MNPHDNEQKVLAWEREIGRANPKFIKYAGIAEFEPVDRFSETDIGCMGDQQKRNGKPERKLPSLVGGNAKVASAIEGVQSERAMNDQRGIEDEMAGKRLPRLQQKAPSKLKRLD